MALRCEAVADAFHARGQFAGRIAGKSQSTLKVSTTVTGTTCPRRTGGRCPRPVA